jgi:hypothetical protein
LLQRFEKYGFNSSIGPKSCTKTNRSKNNIKKPIEIIQKRLLIE